MIDPRAAELLETQEGVVAVWQLARAGVTRAAVRHLVADLRCLHDGVYLSGHAPITERQHWWSAVLTAPGRVLSHNSAANCHRCRRYSDSIAVVTGTGTGGPRRFGKVLLCRSRRLEPADITHIGGLPVTTGARTVLDLMPWLGDKAARRLVREALRVKAATSVDLRAVCARHRGRAGVTRLRALADEYAPLPAGRTKSDAEFLGLELLQAAGRPAPRVNVYIADEETDLSWEAERLIIELDGPDFHRFPSEDARKDAAWRGAGWTVHRLPTDDVYDRPHRLLALAPPTAAA